MKLVHYRYPIGIKSITDCRESNSGLIAILHQYLWERLSRFGAAEGGIRKMRSLFFERSGCSADTGTPPAGSGGKKRDRNQIVPELVMRKQSNGSNSMRLSRDT